MTTEPLFREPGRYEVRMVTRDDTDHEVVSNALDFEVEAADGDEAAVMRELGGNVQILSAMVGLEDQERLRDAIRRYPDSRYLRYAKLQLLEARALDVHNGIDREQSGTIWELKSPEREERRKELWRGLVADLAQESLGAYEDRRLHLSARCARAAGDEAEAQRLRTELRRRFPKSPVTRRLGEEEATE